MALGVTALDAGIVFNSAACGSEGITDADIEILVIGFCLQVLFTVVCITLNKGAVLRWVMIHHDL